MSSWKCDNCQYKKIQKEREIQNKQNSGKKGNLGNLCIFDNLCIGNQIPGNICENTEIKRKLGNPCNFEKQM